VDQRFLAPAHDEPIDVDRVYWRIVHRLGNGADRDVAEQLTREFARRADTVVEPYTALTRCVSDFEKVLPSAFCVSDDSPQPEGQGRGWCVVASHGQGRCGLPIADSQPPKCVAFEKRPNSDREVSVSFYGVPNRRPHGEYRQREDK
jgi:hypothetical protein